jgi:carboxyl-terminal processing protease
MTFMMNPLKRASLALVVLVIISSVFAIGYQSGKSSVSATPSINVLNSTEGEPTNVDFTPFWRAWGILDDKFAGTTTPDQEKIWGAIKGLTKSFNDPYTVFMPPEESKMFEEEVSGQFQGIGMEVGIKDNILTVVAPLKDTPAERAGIKPGDRIIKINDTITDGFSIDKAIKLIRGNAGTSVTLTLLRDNKAPFDVSITRAFIDLPVVGTQIKNSPSSGGTSSTTADGGTGLRKDGAFVIELYSFSANSAQLFRKALQDFIKTGSSKLVIDLRGNPGGYLDAAVDIASWFLPPGSVVVTEKHKDATEQVHRSKGYDVFSSKPIKIAILINGGSASASEILSGALSDHGIAKLIGTKSFGKGSVQELIKLTPDTSLKVTIAKWLTPNGVSISEKGIKPDYEVKITEDDIKAKKDPQMDKAIEILNQ